MGCTGGEIWGTVTALGNASSKERCVGTRAVPFALWMRPEYQKSPFSVWGSGASGFGIFFPAPLLQSANPYLARDHHPSLALAPHDWGC